jgi:hypothetical protein
MSKETYESAEKKLKDNVRFLFNDVDEVIKLTLENCNPERPFINDFYFRTLVRTIFPAIDGTLYHLKKITLELDEAVLNKNLEEKDIAFLRDKKFEKGKITDKPTRPDFDKLVKETLSIYLKAHGYVCYLDFIESDWQSLQRSNKNIRAAYVHPTDIVSFELKNSDYADLKKGYDWFKETVLDAINKVSTHPSI